jgi:hypothetical protein
MALVAHLWDNWPGVVPYCRLNDAGYMVALSLAEKAGDLVVGKRQRKHQGMHRASTAPKRCPCFGRCGWEPSQMVA